VHTKELTDKSGRHRLTMHYVAEGKGANFHSLIWAISDGSEWTERVVISRVDFQPPTKHARWVSNLYSFDPDTGRAIIQVAEGDVRLALCRRTTRILGESGMFSTIERFDC
jgi:hypothetical protein